MKQNKYDDPEFFAKYAEMPRSKEGLAAAAEWTAFRALISDLKGKRVLDLGCGFGWHCRYAREKGAAAVTGVDLSEKMLERARAMTADPAITYIRVGMEDIDFADDTFDVVISSLAFHYVERLDRLASKLHGLLVKGGALFFSTEHPIFTAREEQDWYLSEDGTRLHWPLDDYHREGIRHTRWIADDVVKYHRTIATTVDTLIDTGFRIVRLLEPAPSEAMIAERPWMNDELRRPIFLIVSAINEK